MDEKTAKEMADWVPVVPPFCDEPVWGAAMLQHGGTWAAGVSQGAVGGLGGMLFGRSKAKENADRNAGLPGYTVLVVGPTKVYALEYTQRRKEPYRGPVAVWDRNDLEAEVDVRRVASKLRLRVRSTGETFDLESVSMNGSMGRVLKAILALLEDPAHTPETV